MSDYEGRLAGLVEDFINTYDLYLEEPEHLRDTSDLQRFLVSHGIETGQPITHQTLEQVRQLRTHLRECWAADSLEEMAQRLNPLLARAQVVVQVEPEGQRLSLQFDVPVEAPLVQRLAVNCAAGMIVVVQNYGLERMRSCAAEPCRDVFVDVSRNKSRRFCSERCANRYNVAAFRERQKHID